MNPPAQNLAQPAKQVLVDLINRANLTSFQLADLAFGAPAAGTVAGKNTDVVVSAQGNGTTWTGSATIHYNRLDLGQIFAATGATVELQPGYTTTLDIANALNAGYGLGLSSDDIVSTALPGTGYPQLIAITAKPTSLGYIGTYNVMVADYNGSQPPGTTVVPYHTANASLGAPFLNGSSKLWLDGASVDGHFFETTNEEITMGARAFDNTVGPINGDGSGHYSFNPVAGHAWHAEFAAAVDAGEVVTTAYDVVLTISDANGDSLTFPLTHDGTGFHLIDNNDGVTLPVAYSAADGSQVQFKVDVFGQLAAHFAAGTNNGTEMTGTITFGFKATKKGASVPVVDNTIVVTCLQAA